MKPEVVRYGVLDMQVCVPKEFTDDEVKAFAEQAYPAGTRGGWSIRKQGSPYLAGADERVQCCDHAENVHIVLDV